MPVKLVRLLPYITIGCCFDSHPRIDSVLHNPGFRYGLLKNAVNTMRIFDVRPEIASATLSMSAPLGDVSFEYFVNAIPSSPVETKWLHVSLCTTPTGDTQQEESCVVDVALRELQQNGYSVTAENCKVLHIRELRYESKTPDEVQKSKLFVVLAGPNLLVSVCDGESKAVARCREVVTTRSDATPIELATEIIKESLRPVRNVRMGFDRFIQPLSDHARRRLLDEEQQTSLDKIKRASGYATMRLLDMQSSAVQQLIDLIDHSPVDPTNQTARADLVRLGNMLGVEVTAFKKIEELIEDVRGAHQEMLSRRLIEETEENNQLQKEAERRKQRTDAQWQILGGLSVPVGVALGVIQSFQLSREAGVAVVAVSSLVSTALVYFRNDWFSWIYTSRPASIVMDKK